MTTDLEVRIHNALTNARYEYTALQANIFYVLLSKLEKDAPNNVYRVTVSELEEGTGSEYNYKQLRESTKGMMGRTHEINTLHDGYEVLRQLGMFKRIDYILGTGNIEVEFNEYATQYLFDLKKNFTSFQVQAALSLTSKHAKRIYQICSQWKDKGETRKTTLLDLKKTLGLANDKGREDYTDLAMFKKKVLDVAVRQVNAKTDLLIGYKLEKVGRAFKNIVFTVKPQDVPQRQGAPQPLALRALPDEVPGLTAEQVDVARRLLINIGIITPALVDEILASPAHILGCNKFSREVKMGTHVNVGSLSGYLLTKLGLVKPANGPLFDKPTSKTTSPR